MQGTKEEDTYSSQAKGARELVHAQHVGMYLISLLWKAIEIVDCTIPARHSHRRHRCIPMSGDCNNRFGPAQQWVIPFSRVQKNQPTTNHLLNNQKVSAISFR
jgi:hypothetical protein